MSRRAHAHVLPVLVALSVASFAMVGAQAQSPDDDVEEAERTAYKEADKVYARVLEEYAGLIAAYDETYAEAVDGYYRSYAKTVHAYNYAALRVQATYAAAYTSAVDSYHQTYGQVLAEYGTAYAAALDAYHATYDEAATSQEAATIAALAAYDITYQSAASSYEQAYAAALGTYDDAVDQAADSYHDHYRVIRGYYGQTYGASVEQYGAVEDHAAQAYRQARPTLDLAYDEASAAYDETVSSFTSAFGAAAGPVKQYYNVLRNLPPEIEVGPVDTGDIPFPMQDLPSLPWIKTAPDMLGSPFGVLPSDLPKIITPPSDSLPLPLPQGFGSPVAPPPGGGVPLPGESPFAPPSGGVPLPGDAPFASPEPPDPPSDDPVADGSAPSPPDAPNVPDESLPEESPFAPSEEAPLKDQARSLFEPGPGGPFAWGGAPLPGPQRDALPLLPATELETRIAVMAAVAGLGLLSLLGAGLGYLVRSGYLPTSLFGLFSRKEGDEVLDHELRMVIMDIIGSNPGITLAGLVKKVGATRSAVRYHLRVLGREHHLQVLSEGRTTHLFVTRAADAGPDRLAALACLAHEQRQKIARLIMKAPGMSQSDVAEATGLPPSRIHTHVKHLIDTRLVRRQRDGRYLRYLPTDALLVMGQRVRLP